MKTIAIVAAAVLLLTGCVSMGTNYSDAAVDQLKPGMTKAEVVALLGKPNGVAIGPTGNTVMTWVHSTGSVLGANAKSITLMFDSSGHYTGAQNQGQTQLR